jgi:hypothetical protein
MGQSGGGVEVWSAGQQVGGGAEKVLATDSVLILGGVSKRANYSLIGRPLYVPGVCLSACVCFSFFWGGGFCLFVRS